VTRLVVAGFVALALLGCNQRDDARKAPQAGSSAAPQAGSSAAPPASDPWATSSKPALESVADTACPTVTAPYFFRIEKNGKTSYLLGTRHIGVAWRKMPEVVHRALRESKLVVFETVDGDDSDNSPTPTKTARDALGPELWKRYRELAGDALADEVETEAPASAVLMLMVKYEDRFSMLERQIIAEVEELHVPMLGLETDAFQQKLLDKYLDGRAARAFVEHLDGIDELREDTIDDLRTYCGGTDTTPGIDPDERADMLDSGYTEAEIATMDREMLFDRNRSWIPQLEKLFATDGVFVAVGADHTRGDQGVPALLTAKGFTVTRVTPPTK